MNLYRWAWLILPLGLCRATQLVLWDRIFQKPRDWLLSKLNPHGYSMRDSRRGYLAYLLACPWCMSVWLAAIAVALTDWRTTRHAALLVLLVLALSLLAVGVDHAFDRWLPDEPHDDQPSGGDTFVINGPPGHVAEAFDHLTGDNATGTS